MRLAGKTAVVTGASAGMGEAIAALFAREGANVVAVARRLDRLEQLAAAEKDAPGKILPCRGDIGEPATSRRMVDLAVTSFGRLDILVNNAGIMDDNTAVGDVSDEMIHDLLRVNTCGPLYAMREAIRAFLAQGDEGGNIINIASVGAVHQTAGVAYCASKAALVSATRNTAYMYMERGIRCNAISPGGVLTDIPLVMPKANDFGFGRTSALLAHSPEMGMPEDIANAAMFLASDESKFINGVVLACDGGWTSF